MDKVLVLKATESGTVGVEMPFDKEAGLDFYYQNLDCDTIDIVEAHGLVELKLKDFCLVCDDEGIFNGGKVNGIASLLYGFMEHGQPLVGHVMVCKNKYTDDGIETVGMTDDDLKTLYTAIEKLVHEYTNKK